MITGAKGGLFRPGSNFRQGAVEVEEKQDRVPTDDQGFDLVEVEVEHE